MNNINETTNKSKKGIKNKLQHILKAREEQNQISPFSTNDKYFQAGYQHGVKEALQIAVNLMFDKCYQDIETEYFDLIEKVLEDYQQVNQGGSDE